ncbi:MAG: DUF2269 family protein [Gaiellaceae bacterium]
MELYDWLLSLHVLSAFAWVAALVLYTVVIVAGWGLSVPSDVARMFRVTRVGDALIAVGMIGTIVFGIWLAVDEYQIWDGWIIAALILWLVAGAVGGQVGKVYNGTRDRAKALVDEGRDAPSPELSAMLRSQRSLVLHVLMILVVLALLVVMIYRPGA